MKSSKRTARTAGLLYLIVAITGFFVPFVNKKLLIFGDASATSSNILANEVLFRSGFFGNILMATSWIFTAYVLYTLLKGVENNIALLMFSLVCVGGSLIFIGALCNYTALMVLRSNEYSAAFGAIQTKSVAMLLIDLSHQISMFNRLFYGLWLVPLGYLIFKSNFIPRIIGILLGVSVIGYLIDFVITFTLPNLEFGAGSYTFWGEVILLLWLLVKGVSEQKRTRIAA
jgi:hypothetical protein